MDKNIAFIATPSKLLNMELNHRNRIIYVSLATNSLFFARELIIKHFTRSMFLANRH
jgi:hypothetical protein